MMDGWTGSWDDKFHACANKGRYHAGMRSICMQPRARAAITIDHAGFDVQALVACVSLRALSHNNLDDYHPKRLLEHFSVCLRALCSVPASLSESVCMCVCVNVFVL